MLYIHFYFRTHSYVFFSLFLGSAFPALADKTLRLYNMRFCPYAQRTLLVLHHLNIPSVFLSSQPWINCSCQNIIHFSCQNIFILQCDVLCTSVIVSFEKATFSKKFHQNVSRHLYNDMLSVRGPSPYTNFALLTFAFLVKWFENSIFKILVVFTIFLRSNFYKCTSEYLALFTTIGGTSSLNSLPTYGF